MVAVAVPVFVMVTPEVLPGHKVVDGPLMEAVGMALTVTATLADVAGEQLALVTTTR